MNDEVEHRRQRAETDVYLLKQIRKTRYWLPLFPVFLCIKDYTVYFVLNEQKTWSDLIVHYMIYIFWAFWLWFFMPRLKKLYEKQKDRVVISGLEI